MDTVQLDQPPLGINVHGGGVDQLYHLYIPQLKQLRRDPATVSAYLKSDRLHLREVGVDAT
jgi:hypothetical protein